MGKILEELNKNFYEVDIKIDEKDQISSIKCVWNRSKIDPGRDETDIKLIKEVLKLCNENNCNCSYKSTDMWIMFSITK